MGYLVSFLTGALGFAIFDKSTEVGGKTNLITLGIQAGVLYYLFKKFFK